MIKTQLLFALREMRRMKIKLLVLLIQYTLTIIVMVYLIGGLNAVVHVSKEAKRISDIGNVYYLKDYTPNEKIQKLFNGGSNSKSKLKQINNMIYNENLKSFPIIGSRINMNPSSLKKMNNLELDKRTGQYVIDAVQTTDIFFDFFNLRFKDDIVPNYKKMFSNSQITPVIVGFDFSKEYKVGDVFNDSYDNQYVVSGILDKNMSYIKVRADRNFINLDNRIIIMANPKNVNSADYSRPPLHHACMNGHLEVAMHLISIGAEVNLADMRGYYPIHHAAISGNLQLFMLLVKAGARIDQKTAAPTNDKLLADDQTRRVFAQAGLDDPNPNDEQQPIHTAANYGSLSICQYLIKSKIDPEVKDKNGNPPLYYATDTRMKWFPSKANVIRLFDPKGILEKEFNTLGEEERKFQEELPRFKFESLEANKKYKKIVEDSKNFVRTNGVYIRIIVDSNSKNAHCLEFTKDGKAQFGILRGSDDPQMVKRAFRTNPHNAYPGSYNLTGEILDDLKVHLDVPEETYKTLSGKANGERLVFRPSFFDGGEGYGSYGGEFKFYPD